MPITSEQLRKIKGNLSTLVETGSSNGQGIDAALAAGFQTIYSVERSERYYQLCVQKYAHNEWVHLSCEDSAEWLEDLAIDLPWPVVFFLDAHASAPDSHQGPNPLMRELAAIAKSPIKTHVIIVDDWPSTGFTSEAMLAALQTINPAYEFEFFDVVQGDGSVTKDGMCVARVTS